MQRAVIIGGRGQSGRAIGERLVAAGWDVVATTSSEPPEDGAVPGVRWEVFDREAGEPEAHIGALASVVPDGADVVVDVMAFNARHAAQLIALGERIGSAIVLSTLSVYSDAKGRSLEGAGDDEATFPEWPVPIREDWTTLAPAEEGYSAGKVALEQALRGGAPWPVTIVRPGAIHGRHSKHLREWYFIKRTLDRRRQVVLPYDGGSVFQPTATVNLAELVALAAAKPGARTLNCGDLDPPTVAEISEVVDELTGWTSERVLLPGPPPSATVGSHPWAVPRPVVSDMGRARSELGYVPAASYAEALAVTVPWAIEATKGRDWREVFPALARYPEEQFDYEAEDSFLARPH
jgi:nucleoside-diphosphate-sugar epimerase